MGKKRIKNICRRYAKLVNDVKTDDFYKVDLTNRVNCYVCDCGHITKTKDIDPGVTPFMNECESCGDYRAKSTFYNDIAPEKEPTKEWYRPTLKELLNNNLDYAEHVFNGGLLIRDIKSDQEDESFRRYNGQTS